MNGAMPGMVDSPTVHLDYIYRHHRTLTTIAGWQMLRWRWMILVRKPFPTCCSDLLPCSCLTSQCLGIWWFAMTMCNVHWLDACAVSAHEPWWVLEVMHAMTCSALRLLPQFGSQESGPQVRVTASPSVSVEKWESVGSFTTTGKLHVKLHGKVVQPRAVMRNIAFREDPFAWCRRIFSCQLSPLEFSTAARHKSKAPNSWMQLLHTIAYYFNYCATLT